MLIIEKIIEKKNCIFDTNNNNNNNKSKKL